VLARVVVEQSSSRLLLLKSKDQKASTKIWLAAFLFTHGEDTASTWWQTSAQRNEENYLDFSCKNTTYKRRCVVGEVDSVCLTYWLNRSIVQYKFQCTIVIKPKRYADFMLHVANKYTSERGPEHLIVSDVYEFWVPCNSFSKARNHDHLILLIALSDAFHNKAIWLAK